MRRLAAVAFVLAVGGLAGVAQADDTSGPSGTWKWSAPGRQGGRARENTLKLKVDGDKVTGTISTRDGEVAIEKIAGGARLTGLRAPFIARVIGGHLEIEDAAHAEAGVVGGKVRASNLSGGLQIGKIGGKLAADKAQTCATLKADEDALRADYKQLKTDLAAQGNSDSGGDSHPTTGDHKK